MAASRVLDPLDQSQLSLNTELPLHLFPFRVLARASPPHAIAGKTGTGTGTGEDRRRRRKTRGGENFAPRPLPSNFHRLIRVSGTSWTEQLDARNSTFSNFFPRFGETRSNFSREISLSSVFLPSSFLHHRYHPYLERKSVKSETE